MFPTICRLFVILVACQYAKQHTHTHLFMYVTQNTVSMSIISKCRFFVAVVGFFSYWEAMLLANNALAWKNELYNNFPFWRQLHSICHNNNNNHVRWWNCVTKLSHGTSICRYVRMCLPACLTNLHYLPTAKLMAGSKFTITRVPKPTPSELVEDDQSTDHTTTWIRIQIRIRTWTKNKQKKVRDTKNMKHRKQVAR